MKSEEEKEQIYKRNIRKVIGETDGYFLSKLYEEWSYVQVPGEKKPETRAVVHPSRLSYWFVRHSLLELLASLGRLKQEGFILEFDYIEGDSFDEYEFNNWLHVHFGPNFENMFWERSSRFIKEYSDTGTVVRAAASPSQGSLHLHVIDKKTGSKSHLIFDKTGVIRTDENDTPPGKLISRIDSTLTTRDGKEIRTSFEFD